MQTADCLNCGRTIDASDNFCSFCGQKTALRRLTLQEIGHDAVHYFTHADKGIFHLLKLLAKRPGQLAREYVKGKRKSVFSPLNFFLIVAAVCLFMIGVAQKVTNKQELRQRAGYAQTRSTQQQTPPDPKLIKRYVNLGKFMSSYSNLIPITAIPIISIFMWLFFLGSGYNYAEHLVANMYFSSFALLIYSLLFTVPIGWAGQRSTAGFALITGYFILEVAYRSFAYYHFINKKTTFGLVKSITVNLAISAGWVFFTQYIISVYIRSGFWGLAD